MLAVIAALSDNNRSPLITVNLISSPSFKGSQLEQNLYSIPSQMRLIHRVNDDGEAYNAALLLSYLSRILGWFQLIEDATPLTP